MSQENTLRKSSRLQQRNSLQPEDGTAERDRQFWNEAENQINQLGGRKANINETETAIENGAPLISFEVEQGDIPTDLTNYTVTPPQGQHSSQLEVSPIQQEQKKTPPMEFSQLSSIYTKGDSLSASHQELVHQMLAEDFHEVLGSEEKTKTTPTKTFLPLDWIVPDGRNKTLEEIEEAKVANFPSPGGGHGSVTLSLPHLQPFFGETNFLVDLDTAQLFIWFKKRWLRTGMSCSKVRYDTRSIEHYIEESSRKWRETYLKEEDTQLLVIRDLSKDFQKLPRTNTNQQKKKILPDLPRLAEPSSYRVTNEPLRLETRRNFIRDRTRVALTYILEYQQTMKWTQDHVYPQEELKQRLQIFYGRTDTLRKAIDEGLEEDSKMRRIRNMQYLEDPKRFPRKEDIDETSTQQWLTHMEEEEAKLYAEIDREIEVRDETPLAAGFKPLMSDTDETGTLYEPQNENDPTNNIQKVHTKTKTTEETGARQKVPKTPMTPPQKARLMDETEGNSSHSGQQTKKVTITEQHLLESGRAEPPNYQGPRPEGIPSGSQATQWSYQPKTTELPSYTQLGQYKGLNTWIPPTTYVTPPSATGTTENGKLKENWQGPHIGKAQHTSKLEDARKGQQETNRPNYNYNKAHNQVYAPTVDITTGNTEPQQQQSKLSPQVENRKKTHQEDFFWQDKHLGYEEEAHDTSYLNLPTGEKFNNEHFNRNHTSKYRREENKTCTRCGEKGHIRKNCKVKRTYCEYCKTKTHKTEACIIHLYLKRCPIASSRQSTPEPVRTTQQKTPLEKQQPNRDEIPSRPPPKEKQNPDIQNTDEIPSSSIRSKGNERERCSCNCQCSKQTERKSDTQAITTNTQEITPSNEENRSMNSQGKQTNTNNGPQAQPQIGYPQYYPYQWQNTANIQSNQAWIAPQNQPPQPNVNQNYYMEPMVGQLYAPPGVPWSTQGGTNTIPATDVSKPPPKIDPQTEEKQTVDETKISQPEISLLSAIKDITTTMQKQQLFFEERSVGNENQMDRLVNSLISEQKKREFESLFTAIPTFKSAEPATCAEWMGKVKNACSQSGRSLRQELINKSETLVQEFIMSQGDIDEERLEKKLLTYFSDIPTPAHAAAKLRQAKQQENESVVSFNQRYKQYFERAEEDRVETVTSRLQIEMYLDALIAPVTYPIRQSIYYDTKHAPKTLADTMRKAEDGYMKEIYTRGEYNLQDAVAEKTVTVSEVNTNRKQAGEGSNQYYGNYAGRQRNENFSSFSTKQEGIPSGPSKQWRQTSFERKQDGNPSGFRTQAHNLPRGSLTHILVNPLNLDDAAFNAWMERLVEARRNRLNKVTRPYREHRQPYHKNNDQNNANRKPNLRQAVQPVQEIDTAPIIDMFRCTYEDIEEAIDLYNLDVEECQSA